MFEVGNHIDGRYAVLSILGKGGFGIVYKAKQLSTGQIVALKLLLPQLAEDPNEAAGQTARFQREIELIAQLKHPNIVPLIDSGTLDTGQPYMVLEFVTGQDLEVTLKNEGALEPREAKRLMMQVLDALACAHGQGIIHRDLKPANIMLVTTGARRNAVVLDFGIGGIVEAARGEDYQALTAAGKVFGTPAYMAPEQFMGRTSTPQIDIYAWGMVFIEALTGSRAIAGDSIANIIVAATSKPVPIPPWLQPDLRHIIELATAKAPEQRFATAVDAMEALDEVHIERSTTGRSMQGAQAADRIASLSGQQGVRSQDISLPNAPPARPQPPRPSHPGAPPQHATHQTANAATMAIDANAPQPPAQEKKGSGGLIAIIVILLLACGGGAAYFFLVLNKKDDSKDDVAQQETQGTTNTAQATAAGADAASAGESDAAATGAASGEDAAAEPSGQETSAAGAQTDAASTAAVEDTAGGMAARDPGQLDAACKGGERFACTEYAHHLHKGSAKPDMVTVRKLHHSACLGGVLPGCARLMRNVVPLAGKAKTPSDKLDFAEVLCSTGITSGCATGLVLAADTSINSKSSLSARDRACKANDFQACHLAGIQYFDALGVEKKKMRGRSRFKKACKQGKIPDACKRVNLPVPE